MSKRFNKRKAQVHLGLAVIVLDVIWFGINESKLFPENEPTGPGLFKLIVVAAIGVAGVYLYMAGMLKNDRS